MLDAPHENTHEEAADLALERRDRAGCRGLYLDGDHDRRVASWMRMAAATLRPSSDANVGNLSVDRAAHNALLRLGGRDLLILCFQRAHLLYR